MKPFFITCAAFFAVSLNQLNAAETSTPRKPNIIFILADDLGNGNVSAYGSDNFKTPNIDALAKSGMRFERCFSAPVCGPSRALLMTGRYGFRTGMTGNDKDSAKIMAEATEIMIPKVLKPAGYVTGQVGKWSQVPLEPSDWGFDEYLRFQASGDYWNDCGFLSHLRLLGRSWFFGVENFGNRSEDRFARARGFAYFWLFLLGEKVEGVGLLGIQNTRGRRDDFCLLALTLTARRFFGSVEKIENLVFIGRAVAIFGHPACCRVR